MVVTLIRTVVFYIVVILSLRIMGKRQIGELQPGELVITILISECAAAPIQDLNRPVLNGIIAIFCLVILEVLLSVVTLKWPAMRRAIDGQPAVIIKNGTIDQKAMRKLRLSVDDLANNLRQQGVFNIADVAYAIVETDGNLSVMKKGAKEEVTAEMLDIKQKDEGLPCVVIGDGEIHKAALGLCEMNDADLHKLLKKTGVAQKDVFALITDKSGNYTMIKKEERK